MLSMLVRVRLVNIRVMVEVWWFGVIRLVVIIELMLKKVLW